LGFYRDFLSGVSEKEKCLPLRLFFLLFFPSLGICFSPPDLDLLSSYDGWRPLHRRAAGWGLSSPLPFFFIITPGLFFFSSLDPGLVLHAFLAFPTVRNPAFRQFLPPQFYVTPIWQFFSTFDPGSFPPAPPMRTASTQGSPNIFTR